MTSFDISHENEKSSFAKNNNALLEHFFGTTNVTSFWIADMDYQIAQPITEELRRLIDRGVFAYEFATTEVNNAISTWFNKKHNLSLNPNNFVQVPSVLTAIAVLLQKFSEPEDGILIQTPVYHQFSAVIKNNNRKIIESPLVNTDGAYTMDLVDLAHKFQSGEVKLMILCNPHNPIGRVWKKEELQSVLDLANQYDVKIISDEIHADIVYKPKVFISLMALEAENHFGLIGSTAKTFGMQSISNGFMYIPNQSHYDATKYLVSSMFLDHGNAFTTFATIAAYKSGEPWKNDLINYLKEVSTWIETYTASSLPQIKITPLEGTYQMWLDFSGFGLSTEVLKEKLVSEAKLGLAHGDWFDKSGKHDQFVRFNFASPINKVKDAFYAIKNTFT